MSHSTSPGTERPAGSHAMAAGADHTGERGRTIGQLVADASRDLSALVRAEIALAKAELRTEVKAGALGAGLAAGAAVFGLLGAVFGLFFVVYLLHLALPLWASYLIVAAVLLIIAAVLGVVALGRLKKVGPPQRTVATSKQSIEALKGHH